MPPEMFQSMGLQMAQRQEMVMTPQMIQSMELLQMPLLELEQRIQTELIENPALELADLKTDLFQDGDPDGGSENQNDAQGDDFSPEADEGYEFEDLRHAESVDCDWNELYDDCAPKRGYDDDEERFDIIANAKGRSESYPDHLINQLHVVDCDEKIRVLAEKIIYQLDDKGYLNVSLAELAANPPQNKDGEGLSDEDLELSRLPLEMWEDALEVVQGLHPAGSGARDLRECLLLQLDYCDDPAAYLAFGIVDTQLEDLAANRLPQIAKTCKVSLEEVKDAVSLIHSLDPHPGWGYSGEETIPVRPDVIVELVESKSEDAENIKERIFKAQQELRRVQAQITDEKGEYQERAAKARLHESELDMEMFDLEGMKWEITLPNGPAPEISDIFLALYDSSGRGEMVRQAMMSDPEKAEEFRQMKASLKSSGQNRQFRERFMAASDIVRAVKQREITIYRVTREIVSRQKDYLSGRIPAPAPLMMKEVAEILDIDIGTVSRTARDKYMETPLGLKPMREFFTRAVAPAPTDDNNNAVGASPDGSMSNIQIRNRIKEMIDNEDRKSPLKDDQIQVMLEKEGIVIKRRTVAKHRLKLGYNNYSQRREY